MAMTSQILREKLAKIDRDLRKLLGLLSTGAAAGAGQNAEAVAAGAGKK